MFEGPRIPRSCDPDWSFRDENGYVKEELRDVWEKLQILAISEEAVEELVNRKEPRGMRANIIISDDYDCKEWPIEEKVPKKPTIEQILKEEKQWEMRRQDLKG